MSTTIEFGALMFKAHVTRAPTKSFALSVCALEAERRWTLSGTPVQNRLNDLASLFKFLRCYPFDDQKVFNEHVVRNWKAHADPLSVTKLKTLVNCLSLRRPKSTINLPPREDRTVVLEFSGPEKLHYEAVRSSTRRMFDSYSLSSTGCAFLNTLQWVNELRLVCNHDINVPNVSSSSGGQADSIPWSPKKAQLSYDQLDQVDLAKCSNPECSQDLSLSLSSEMDTEGVDEPWIEESVELLCSTCFKSRASRTGRLFRVCHHSPRCKTAGGPSSANSGPSGLERGGVTPTKIQRIIEDLCQTPNGVKRYGMAVSIRTPADAK